MLDRHLRRPRRPPPRPRDALGTVRQDRPGHLGSDQDPLRHEWRTVHAPVAQRQGGIAHRGAERGLLVPGRAAPRGHLADPLGALRGAVQAQQPPVTVRGPLGVPGQLDVFRGEFGVQRGPSTGAGPVHAHQGAQGPPVVHRLAQRAHQAGTRRLDVPAVLGVAGGEDGRVHGGQPRGHGRPQRLQVPVAAVGRQSLQQAAQPVQPVLFPGVGDGFAGAPLPRGEGGAQPGGGDKTGGLVGVHPQLQCGTGPFALRTLLEEAYQLVQQHPAQRPRVGPVQCGQQAREPGRRGRGTGEAVQQRAVHPSHPARSGGHVQAVEDA